MLLAPVSVGSRIPTDTCNLKGSPRVRIIFPQGLETSYLKITTSCNPDHHAGEHSESLGPELRGQSAGGSAFDLT